MEVVHDNTENLGNFYTLMCSHCAESISKPGLHVFAVLWGQLFKLQPWLGWQVAGGFPFRGNLLSNFSAGLDSANYSSSGEILILDNSPGKGGGWSKNALQPPDLPKNSESLRCAHLA